MNIEFKDNLLMEGNHGNEPESSEMNFDIIENEEDPFDDDAYLDREYRIYMAHLAQQKKKHVSMLIYKFKNLLQKFNYNPNHIIHTYYESLPMLELQAYEYYWLKYPYSTDRGIVALKFEHQGYVSDNAAARILRTVMNEALYDYNAQEVQFTYYLPVPNLERLLESFDKPDSTLALLEAVHNTLTDFHEYIYEDYLRYIQIISIKRPTVTYLLENQVLRMHLFFSEETLETSNSIYQNFVPDFEVTIQYSLLTEEEVEMAKFLENLNGEANGARSFRWQSSIIAYEGFEVFKIPLPAYEQPIKEEWFQNKLNIHRIRKRKIKAALIR